MPSVKRCRLAVTGTHSSGKNYTSRILSQLGFRHFLQEPLNPFSPPGVWLKNKECVYTYCDRDSPEPKQAMLDRKLRRVSGLPLFAKPGGLRDYASLWKASLSRIVLWGSSRSFVIKDPFCLFVADLLKTRLGVVPWIIIRHPADFVAHCMRNSVAADFGSFERDPEFRDRCGGFFDDVRAFARLPNHSDDFHQNIAYWMMCAKITLDLCHRWGVAERYALTLLDTLNDNPEQTFAHALRRCGLHVDTATISRAIGEAQASGAVSSLSQLQQTQDVLTKPRAEDRLSPLTSDMLREVDSATHDLYEQLKAFEARL